MDPAPFDRPFSLRDEQAFNAEALRLFHLHAENNPVYRGFLKALGRTTASVEHWTAIPCLPIGAFRDFQQ